MTVTLAHPSGVRRLHTGRCLKGSAADPVLTATLVNKRSLRVVRTRGVLDDFTMGAVRKEPVYCQKAVSGTQTSLDKGGVWHLAVKGGRQYSIGRRQYVVNILPSPRVQVTIRRGLRLRRNEAKYVYFFIHLITYLGN
ncbi:MAG: hypothetical protein LBK25_09620 [Treponema sp.]|nr:hypothetical protein [Treponema sp.]